jgi:hypothetical protein
MLPPRATRPRTARMRKPRAATSSNSRPPRCRTLRPLRCRISTATKSQRSAGDRVRRLRATRGGLDAEVRPHPLRTPAPVPILIRAELGRARSDGRAARRDRHWAAHPAKRHCSRASPSLHSPANVSPPLRRRYAELDPVLWRLERSRRYYLAVPRCRHTRRRPRTARGHGNRSQCRSLRAPRCQISSATQSQRSARSGRFPILIRADSGRRARRDFTSSDHARLSVSASPQSSRCGRIASCPSRTRAPTSTAPKKVETARIANLVTCRRTIGAPPCPRLDGPIQGPIHVARSAPHRTLRDFDEQRTPRSPPNLLAPVAPVAVVPSLPQRQGAPAAPAPLTSWDHTTTGPKILPPAAQRQEPLRVLRSQARARRPHYPCASLRPTALCETSTNSAPRVPPQISWRPWRPWR